MKLNPKFLLQQLSSKGGRKSISLFLKAHYRQLAFRWHLPLKDSVIKERNKRLDNMSPDCYNKKECEYCGCEVPLMFWSKECEGKCKVKT